MIVLPFNSKHIRGLRPRHLVAGLAVSLAAVMALAGPAGAAVDDPAGNNGTIKIDGVTLDDAPNNEPHPGCSFEVDFYGFDAGAGHNATVTFAVHNPTRGDDLLEVDNDVVFIGGDANDGGGSEPGLDASQGYNLYQALTDGGYEPGRMGYHIKLTVHADGSIGADTKHKVFWVTDCVPPVVTPVDDDDDNEVVVVEDDDDEVIVVNEDDTDDDDEIVVAGTDDEIVVDPVVIPQLNTTDVPVLTAVSNPVTSVTPGEVVGPAVAGGASPTGNDVLVLGSTLTRPDVSAAPSGLARTGSTVAPILVLGAILLMVGLLARRFGRTPRVSRS